MRSRRLHIKSCAFGFLMAVALIVGTLWLVAGMYLHLQQDRILFAASRDMPHSPARFGWDFDEVLLEVDGHETHGWFIPHEVNRATLLFSHGNGGNLSQRLYTIQVLRNLGVSVFAYDYGGFGKSTGDYSEARCYADIRAAWAYLTETRGILPEDIILFGRSLGGGPTCNFAPEVSCAGVVLESTFTSVRDVAGDNPLFALWPARRMLRDQFPNLAMIGAIDAPLLVLHSRDDTLVPFHHGEALYEAATAAEKLFWPFHGTHQTGLFTDEARYLDGWEAFLSGVLER